ncbi:thrombospondin-1-like [Littorina saxatilis]|uniref:thrombospondin-1-like n=1 Tax=Littorina saxatilis TaxID=31220 RepID=UPI0038B55E91
MECCLCVWILTISVGIASATWTEWTACSKTCGGGTRSRNCVATCSTEDSQTEPCNTQGCTCQPGDVRWQEWKEWSACSMTLGSGDTCGNGYRTRLRMCYVARRPTACKSDCSDIAGTFSMEEPCVVCCDDNDRTSSWGDWLQWGQCSVTCGQGERSRSRTCNPPNVNEAGSCASTCVGDATQFDDFCLATQRCCEEKGTVTIPNGKR